MKFKTLAAAACISFAGATATIAAPVPVDFNFEFTDGSETVTGVIQGLVSDGLGQSATSVTVTGLGETVIFTSLRINSFNVTDSVIDLPSVSLLTTNDPFNFQIQGGLFGTFAGFSESNPSGPGILAAVGGDVSFTVSAVPLPASFLLLLSGLGGLAAFKHRTKRAA